MKRIKPVSWEKIVEKIDFAFQPIVNIHTGVCYGYEALLRNHQSCGFDGIDALFDQAYAENVLCRVDRRLLHKTIEKFVQLPWNETVRLFYNLDNRTMGVKDHDSEKILNLLEEFYLDKSALCFEISERHELANPETMLSSLMHYRQQGFKIAVDDFGTGFSGLKLLYYTEPDFVKIDRFFIAEISLDQKKKLFVSSIVNIVHLLGGIVIAEGVETKEEYFSCRDIGCDLIQGYLVQHPRTELRELKQRYTHIEDLAHLDRRMHSKPDSKLIRTEMEYIEPVMTNSAIFEVFKRFRKDKARSIYPVINQNKEPVGVVREENFKDYTYSPFGRELLQNPSFGKTIDKFISKFPIADIHTPIEKVLTIHSQNKNLEGILIADSLKYAGFLSAQSLLNIINEKNLAVARDQNPLSKLPGNVLIHEYVSNVLNSRDKDHILAYFDFDYFKPYNDKYGFRHGDRMIILFAEMLKKYCETDNCYVGHIGGDDFFMGIQDMNVLEAVRKVRAIQSQFKNDAESFYDPETIRTGHIVSKDRDGNQRSFPLMTVSAVLLVLPQKRLKIYSSEAISNVIAVLKKSAKDSPKRFCIASIDEFEEKPSNVRRVGYRGETVRRLSV